MNALQQRMMAKAMAHGEMEGGAMGPVPASQRAVMVKHEGRVMPLIGYRVPGDIPLGTYKPKKKKMDAATKAAWEAANPEQSKLLAAAQVQRARYTAERATGNFNSVAVEKAAIRAQKKAIRESPDYVPKPMSAALQSAHETRAHNTYLRDALGKAVADKYKRAANAALKAGTSEVFVDGILLTDPFEPSIIFAHRQKVIAAKNEAKAARKTKGPRILSFKPSAVAARERTALIKSKLAEAGIVIPKKVRKSGQIYVPGDIVVPGFDTRLGG